MFRCMDLLYGPALWIRCMDLLCGSTAWNRFVDPLHGPALWVQCLNPLRGSALTIRSSALVSSFAVCCSTSADSGPAAAMDSLLTTDSDYRLLPTDTYSPLKGICSEGNNI